jgi:predicted enzyme related to lactoylglutathione lyase
MRSRNTRLTMNTPAAPQHSRFGIAHFDVCGPNLAALTPFYEALFGWQVQPRGPGYAMLQTPAGSPNGALVEAPEAALTVGVVVPDLAAALAQAQQQGGSVHMPATDNGWVRKAQVRDPAGNLLTLIEETPHR